MKYQNRKLQSMVLRGRATEHSNAVGFVTLVLIGQRQKFATVYPTIYCRKQFDVINFVTFHKMTCGIMRLATLQFETKLQKCIRMGITIFEFFIW